MSLRNKLLATAAVLTLPLAGLGLAAGAAKATTLTCTSVASSTVSPFGCGGDQLAYSAKGALDLGVLGTGAGVGNVAGNYWNSPVGFLTDSTSNSREDFTVFAVDGSVKDGPGGLGEYVVMYTPDGVIPGVTPQRWHRVLTLRRTTTACRVENLNNGPKGAVRWHTVLRNCSSNGEFTVENGTNSDSPNNSVTSSRANKYQVWAPVQGAHGLVMINESLSGGFRNGGTSNTPYVLDDTAFGGSGTQALAFPENDGLNQQSLIIGCTNPIKGLEAELPAGGGYYNCP